MLLSHFYDAWNSQDTTRAEICIINQNIDPNGNDFVLDDFAFVELNHIHYDTTVFLIEAIDAAKGRLVFFPNAFSPN